MRYIIMFKWLDDGFKDTDDCYGLENLKRYVKHLKEEGKHEILCIEKELPNGEYVPYNKIKY